MNNTFDLDITNVVPEVHTGLFENIQGNILSGHGRNFARHILIAFNPENIVEAKKWVNDFTNNEVTSAVEQEKQRVAHKKNSQNNALFAGLYLSAFGYSYFGFGDLTQQPSDSAFRQGMSSRQDVLGDAPSSSWEPGFQPETHALILLAYDDEALLDGEVSRLESTLSSFSAINTIQKAAVLRNEKDQVMEPFGFVDGVSNPEFLKRKLAGLTGNKFDSSAPLSLVLAKDPHGGDTAYGSYVVYRKLAQDVDGWNKEVFKLASELDVDPSLAGAYAIGRFQDGTPVVNDSTPQDGPIGNDFNFDEDPNGIKCPFHAHIRKTNPRGQTAELFPGTSLESERDHRIVRRAIAFGTRENNTAGLLFICMQSSIVDQFEFMQASWANANQFIKQNVGQDTVIGQAKQVPAEGQAYPNQWGDESKGTQHFDFKNFISLKGGEYFFAPSIEFLKSL